MLYRSLSIHQIFGANTEVGKTVLSAALCRASLLAGQAVSYLKPIGTGNPDLDGDDRSGCCCPQISFFAHTSLMQSCAPLWVNT